VREHLGPGGEHLGQQCRLSVEVRDQQLHAAVREQAVDLPYGLGVQPRPTVGQVVAGDTGDRRVPQTHRDHRLGDPAGLVGVEVGGRPGVDLAEVAPARALVAADEEGRLAVLPTLVDVGAAGLLAHRVQALPLDQAAQLGELRTHAGSDLDPRRLALDRGLRVAGLDAQQPAAIRSNHRHACSLAPRTPQGA
jgi:hypothetical protein